MVCVVFGSIPSSYRLRDKISLRKIASLELHLAHTALLSVDKWVGRKYQHIYHLLKTTWHSFGRVCASIYSQIPYCPCQVNMRKYFCACGFTSCHSEVFDCAVLHVVQFFWVFLQGYMQTLHPLQYAQQHSKERRNTTRNKCRGSCTNRDIDTVVSICHITVRGL